MNGPHYYLRARLFLAVRRIGRSITLLTVANVQVSQ